MIFLKGHFKISRLQKSIIIKSLNKTKTHSSTNVFDTKTTVFLSHKHNDLEEIEETTGVIEMLEGLGEKVYIDSLENKMPNQMKGETSTRIKKEIKYCDKFELLASNNAISTKCCNWELGFGDAYKYIQYIALFPFADSSTGWNRNEYLRIYSRIEENELRPEYFKVIFPYGTAKTLSEWLTL